MNEIDNYIKQLALDIYNMSIQYSMDWVDFSIGGLTYALAYDIDAEYLKVYVCVDSYKSDAIIKIISSTEAQVLSIDKELYEILAASLNLDES